MYGIEASDETKLECPPASNNALTCRANRGSGK